MKVLGRNCERGRNVVDELSLTDYSEGMVDFRELLCEDCFDDLTAEFNTSGVGREV